MGYISDSCKGISISQTKPGGKKRPPISPTLGARRGFIHSRNYADHKNVVVKAALLAKNPQPPLAAPAKVPY